MSLRSLLWPGTPALINSSQNNTVGLLFLKQCLCRSPESGLFVFSRIRPFARREVITEVGAVLFADHVGLSFAALVIDLRIIMLTVFTNMNIRTAMRTLITTADIPGECQLFVATKTVKRCCHLFARLAGQIVEGFNRADRAGLGTHHHGMTFCFAIRKEANAF